MVICLERGADLHSAQLMPLPLTLPCFRLKSRLVLPSWYQLTRVVPDKGPLNGRVCVINTVLLTYISLLCVVFLAVIFPFFGNFYFCYFYFPVYTERFVHTVCIVHL